MVGFRRNISLNQDRNIYVGPVLNTLMLHSNPYMTSQGPDVNPDRFINESGEVSFPDIGMVSYSLAFIGLYLA